MRYDPYRELYYDEEEAERQYAAGRVLLLHRHIFEEVNTAMWSFDEHTACLFEHRGDSGFVLHPELVDWLNEHAAQWEGGVFGPLVVPDSPPEKNMLLPWRANIKMPVRRQAVRFANYVEWRISQT